ncbi:arsenate reductase (glutaredoxin) [Rheinheimera sp. MMS21-TC3]|uniref:arsenate reductase (glutaredoxin) n=1 Tax=Rheinheimera sp. MMS21-TC3 TaxID=3072790 RepID=UPI0028C479EB|nr:arsenate reductase (glutaredoxin) [Rheinheimera sp. MMS21-TC3]WNO60798.1 arsenate reductase (glutaredoxin) [Rheinheimera sp. MMS21-TC3]
MLTIYHNPRCSKSREVLELINDYKQDVEVVEYLKTPPSADELKSIISKLGISARQLLRSKEPEYLELGLADTTLSEAELIAAMVANPKLIERPIVIDGDKAVIGRPTTNVLNLIA